MTHALSASRSATPTTLPSSELSPKEELIAYALRRWRKTYPTYGQEMSPEQADSYFESLEDLPEPILREALADAVKTCTAFPMPADILQIASRLRVSEDHGTSTRKFCSRCKHTGFIYVTDRGVKPCSCRAWLPPSPSGPDRAVGGGLRQIGEGVAF